MTNMFSNNMFKDSMNNLSFGSLVTGAGSLFSGYSKFKASKQQSQEIEYQGLLALKESLRDASIIREEGESFAASQSLQYIGSGVEIVGSALITMAQTKKYANTEARAVEERGRARRDYAYRQANIIRDEGRAALIGGIVNAGASILTAGVI